MSEQPLEAEVRTLKNQVDYLEQIISGFIAHFNVHGHTHSVLGNEPTSRPPIFRYPLFHPAKAPISEVKPPSVEAEVTVLTMPGSKPQPIPVP